MDQPPNASAQTPASPTYCPSCKMPLKTGEAQCPQCGLILAKWKDPAQRAAEIKLAELGKQSQGLPNGLLIAMALVVGVPLLIAFVPDIGVPLVGVKLRYRLEPESAVHFH